MALNEDFAEDFGEVQPSSNQATLRANQSRNLPSSLRLLFEDGSTPVQPETRRLNLNMPDSALTSQFWPITPEVTQAEDALPLPPSSRARTPLRPFLNHNASTSSLEVSQVTTTSVDVVVEEKLLNGRFPISADDNAYIPEDEMVTNPISLNRKFEGISIHQDLDLASPASFQFPLPSPATERPLYRGLESRSPSTRPGTSLSTHQNTLSLDAPSISAKNDYIPTSMARSRSATTPTPPAIDLGYERLSNIMETKRVDLNFAPPNRSTPGLKDVLKVRFLSKSEVDSLN
jgi:protein-serine/threonine kinase